MGATLSKTLTVSLRTRAEFSVFEAHHLCTSAKAGHWCHSLSPPHSTRTNLFSGYRRSLRCCSKPTLTTLTRPSSTTRSTTPSAYWRRPWTWCPPLLSGFPSPGSTDIHSTATRSLPSTIHLRFNVESKLWITSHQNRISVDKLLLKKRETKKLMTDVSLPRLLHPPPRPFSQQPERHIVV